MKILFLINSLGAGGAEQSLAEMLLPLAPRVDPLVVCLQPSREGVEGKTRAAGFDVRFLTSAGFLTRVREFHELVRSERPDLVHTTIFDADVLGRVGAVGTQIPVLTSLVNTSYDPVRLQDPAIKGWKLRGAQTVDGWTARHLTTHFHAITGAVRDAAVRDLRIDPGTVTVIERGRDPQRLGMPGIDRRARARQALGVGTQDLVLATLGRQEFQKGQWNLLEALPKVLTGHPAAILLLAGREGNASSRLRRTARAAGVEGSVRFLGHRDDAPEVLAAADVFVFPSLYEGLGGALIEAMALGLPIVASDLPAIREVVESGKNALLVEPGSPSDLADAIIALADDPERRRRMGARSRAIFEDRFTLEHSALRMLDLFERVAAGGRQGSR